MIYIKLVEGLSEPEFYGDLVYKFKKLIGINGFSFHKLKIRCDISVKFKFKEHPCCIVNYDSTYFGNLIYMHMSQIFVTTYEPHREKTNNLHMRKQRRRSASR